MRASYSYLSAVVIVGILIIGVFLMLHLIRRRVIGASCLLGASVGGITITLLLALYGDGLFGVSHLWGWFLTSLGLQKTGTNLNLWISLGVHGAAIFCGMTLGGFVGWWLTREKER